MLSEKNTLWRPWSLWFTGCRAGSPGQRPFCASASISVPGAPAPSLATGNQDLASNPGLEICAPDWVAFALLATRQPCAPRSVTSLAPVAGPGPAGKLRLAGGFARVGECRPAVLTGAAPPGSGAVLPGLACAAGEGQASKVAARARQVPRASGGRMVRFTAGNSCLRPWAASGRPVEAQLVRILSKQTLSRPARSACSVPPAAPCSAAATRPISSLRLILANARFHARIVRFRRAETRISRLQARVQRWQAARRVPGGWSGRERDADDRRDGGLNCPAGRFDGHAEGVAREHPRDEHRPGAAATRRGQQALRPDLVGRMADQPQLVDLAGR